MHQKSAKWNTTLVPGANGVVRLSVPLLGGRSTHATLGELRIAYRDNWVLQHTRTLDAAFMRAPFYEFYRDEFFGLLQQRPEKLIDLNLALMDWVLKKLKWPGTWSLSSPPDPLLKTDALAAAMPTQPKRYPQVFEDRNGFLPGMTILDLLSALGPATPAHLLPVEAAH